MSGVAELNPTPAPLAALPAEQRDKTIPQFCEKKNISLSLYYTLKRAGHGPREKRYPGSAAVRISAEAERDWDRTLEQWAQTEDAEIESQRRTEQRRIAGTNAAQSAKHVNNAGARVGKVGKQAQARGR